MFVRWGLHKNLVQSYHYVLALLYLLALAVMSRRRIFYYSAYHPMSFCCLCCQDEYKNWNVLFYG